MNRIKGKSTAINIHELTWMALLIALEMVLIKLTFGSAMLKVGFSFIAVGLMGYYFGPYKAAIANGVADIISNVVLGSNGSYYFWGFTLSAILSGIIVGFMLHNRKVTFLNVFITILLITVFINTLLNTLWVSIMTSNPYQVMLVTRLPKQIIALVYQTGILYMILKWVDKSRFNKIGR